VKRLKLGHEKAQRPAVRGYVRHIDEQRADCLATVLVLKERDSDHDVLR
jgi:hypothetical protein